MEIKEINPGNIVYTFNGYGIVKLYVISTVCANSFEGFYKVIDVGNHAISERHVVPVVAKFLFLSYDEAYSAFCKKIKEDAEFRISKSLAEAPYCVYHHEQENEEQDDEAYMRFVRPLQKKRQVTSHGK